MRRGALAGRRIVELADEKGVYCGKLFADLGAEVIKVERPGGDATRSFPPFLRRDPARSLFFLAMNTNKKSVTLDLKREEGRGLFRRLVAQADALIETTMPGELDDAGLGYAALSESRPQFVMTSITGFGQTGPRRNWKTSDLVANALGGVAYVTGAAEDPPVTLAGSQAYVMASTLAASSTLMALLHAGRGGVGQYVDISIQESTLAFSHISGVGKWLDDGMVPRRMGTGLFASVPSGAYPCRDGQIYLMVNRPAHWQALAEWIHETVGEESVLDPLFSGPSANRIPYRDMIDHFIAELTRRYSVQETYREGQRRHLAMTPVHPARAVVEEPQLAARDFFVSVHDADIGTIRYPGPPYRHSATPWVITAAAPAAGQHNEDVFTGLLGIPPIDLSELKKAGVI